MMIKLRNFLAICLLGVATIATANAQNAEWTEARAEIHRDICLSASNLAAYREPDAALTPTPAGYEPFYMSHYGRHGSRWLINKNEYTDVIDVLQRGHDAGALTERGELLLRQIKEIYKVADGRFGDLTSVGESQLHHIGKRFAERFPEIFCRPETQIDARATIVTRCILSMTAACEEIAAANPQAKIHNDVSKSFQYYLNADRSERAIADNIARKKAAAKDFNKNLHPERFWAMLFRDPEYRDKIIQSRRQMMKKVFYICGNQQSHEPYISLYDLFTEEECYELWRGENVNWYVENAQGTAPFTQAALLKNIIATADEVVGSRTFRGATLRFGHDFCLMSLAALLELGNCYPEIPAADIYKLDKVWANFRIVPMASNIQLVFYRPTNGTGDILVKALLNERETTLPTPPTQGPYYNWCNLRSYYLKKLATYEQGND